MSEDRDHKKLVLVVEDDDALCNVLAELLETEGYSVVQAGNGVDGLQLALKRTPDVILLDLGMPHRSGLDVLQALKQTAPTREIPVLIISGYAMVLMDTNGHGADGVIQKPFNLDHLLEQVERASSSPRA
jgi:two-component system KDP operon response regulator KdpE